MRLKIGLSIFLLCNCNIATILLGQQYTLNPMYNLDSYESNIGHAGLTGKSIISLMYRNQWDKLDGSPNSFHVNYSSPLKIISSAIGFSIGNEKSGIHSNTDIKASYNYVYTNSEVLLSFAGGLKYQNFNINYNAIRTPEGIYLVPSIFHNDPLLAQRVLNQTNFGLIAGLFAQSKWLNGGIEFNRGLLYLSKNDKFFKRENLVKIYLVREIPYEDWTFSASFLNLTDFRKNQEEIQLGFRYKDQYSIHFLERGLRTKSFDAVGIQFSFKLNRGIWLAYLMEWPTNSLKSQINSINQQFGLKFDFYTSSGNIKYPIIYNPRW